MAKTAPDARAQIDAYMRAQPPEARKALKQVRAIVRATVPAAVEHFSYQMPAFRLDDRGLIWYAAFTGHYSIFPVGAQLVRSLGKAAEKYETSNKGTIRFPLEGPVPVSIVRKIVKARIVELRRRGK